MVKDEQIRKYKFQSILTFICGTAMNNSGYSFQYLNAMLFLPMSLRNASAKNHADIHKSTVITTFQIQISSWMNWIENRALQTLATSTQLISLVLSYFYNYLYNVGRAHKSITSAHILESKSNTTKPERNQFQLNNSQKHLKASWENLYCFS